MNLIELNRALRQLRLFDAKFPAIHPGRFQRTLQAQRSPLWRR